MMSSRPPNIQILEDFAGDLDPDGLHYSIMAGVLYVQGLHDQAIHLSLTPPQDPRLS